jgi:hypothetical protein
MADGSVQFVHDLVDAFPRFHEALSDHLSWNDEVLPHVFFGDVTRAVEADARAGQTDELPALVAFLERRFVTGDEAVQNVICVSFLEYIDDAVRPFLGPVLTAALHEVEEYMRKLAELDKS